MINLGLVSLPSKWIEPAVVVRDVRRRMHLWEAFFAKYNSEDAVRDGATDARIPVGDDNRLPW
jgi:hypothetical protein